MLSLRLIKIVTSVDTALGFDDFAISFISLIAAVIGIFVAVRVHKSKEELEDYKTKIDKKLLRLSELQTSLSKELDEVKINIFNSKVLTVMNLLEMTNKQGENSQDIYTNLVGFSRLVPDSFNNLRIFYDYIVGFNLLLSAIIVYLEKINPKHYGKIFTSMDIIKKRLELSRLKVPMDEEYSEKIAKGEDNMNKFMKNLKKKIKEG